MRFIKTTEELKKEKITKIQKIIDTSIKNFVDSFELRYQKDVKNINGVINKKKKNVFIKELGEEFMFYSAFVRSFDSSFGGVLENIGNSIAELTYDVRNDIESYILSQQTQHIDTLMSEYDKKTKPKIDDYKDFKTIHPKEKTSFLRKHKTDNYFYEKETKTHYIIELKAGGDLDTKKAKAEKITLLIEYFLLKNKLIGTNEKVIIKFATAYNKDGEGNKWIQSQVRYYFAEEELLIGKDYWNFVCKEKDGFEIVFNQYRKSSSYIKESLQRILKMYFK